MAYSCVRVHFEIGHEAVIRSKRTPDGFTHDWEVFVRGADNAEIHHFVEKVVFHLHETFKNPKRIVKEPPYSVKESGYAGFNLPIDIYLKTKEEGCRKIRFFYDLTLQLVDTGSARISNVVKEKFDFPNPAEDFRRKLIRGGGVGTSTPDKSGLSNSVSHNSSNNVDDAKNLPHVPSKSSKTAPPPIDHVGPTKKHKTSNREATRPEETRLTNSFAELFGTPIKTVKQSPNAKPPSKSDSKTGDKSKPKQSPAKEKGDKEKGEKDKRDKDADRENKRDKESRSKEKESKNEEKSTESKSKEKSKKSSFNVKDFIKKEDDRPKKEEKEKERSSSKSSESSNKSERKHEEKRSRGEESRKDKHKKEEKDKSKEPADKEKQAEKKQDKEAAKEKEPPKVEKPKVEKEEKKKEKSEAKHKHKKKDKHKRDEEGGEKAKKKDKEKEKRDEPEPAPAKKKEAPPKEKEKPPPARSPSPPPPPPVAPPSSSKPNLALNELFAELSDKEDSDSDFSGPEEPPVKVEKREISPPPPVKVKSEPKEPEKAEKSKKKEKKSKVDEHRKRKRKHKEKDATKDEPREKTPKFVPSEPVAPTVAPTIKEEATSPRLGAEAAATSRVAPSPQESRTPKSSPRSRSASPPPPPQRSRRSRSRSRSAEDDGDTNSTLFTEEYINQLKDLQHKIMTLQDNADLQRVVQVISETGQFEITQRTFDFDLCALDPSTVKMLQDMFIPA